MAHNDWDPDELLQFDYKKPVPGRDYKKTPGGAPAPASDDVKIHAPIRENTASNNKDIPAPLRESKAAQPSRSSGKPLGDEILPPLSEGRSKPHTSAKSESKASSEELRRYAELRHSSTEGTGAQKSASVSSASNAPAAEKPKKSGKLAFGRKPKKQTGRKRSSVGKKSEQPAAVPPGQDYHMSYDEDAALKKAQQEAYDRYRSTYSKNYLKNKKNRQPHLSHKILSVIYVIGVVVFAASLTIMDVLPFSILAMIYGILALLSLIIVLQLRKNNLSRWVRVLASLAAVVLVIFYGVGTAYALGTLSFLNFTSVKNENKVASVTQEPFNVVITGIDAWGKIDEEGRSDVNMVITVNPNTEQILLTSIPRDYQIYMPDKDYAMDKLTHTGFYSVETTIGAEEDLLDTKINYYVKVNFSTVEKFIDAIGGIDVESEYEFVPVKLDTWTVKKGMNHMNGEQALAFARERKAFLTGDNQRVKNQQAVFEAMIKKATSSKTMLLSYNKVISSLKKYIRMSISSSEFRQLIKFQIAKDPEWKIFKNALVGDNGSMGTYTTGSAQAYVMLQDQYSIDNARTLIKAVQNGSILAEDDDGAAYVKEDASAEGEESGDSEQSEE